MHVEGRPVLRIERCHLQDLYQQGVSNNRTRFPNDSVLPFRSTVGPARRRAAAIISTARRSVLPEHVPGGSNRFCSNDNGVSILTTVSKGFIFVGSLRITVRAFPVFP